MALTARVKREWTVSTTGKQADGSLGVPRQDRALQVVYTDENGKVVKERLIIPNEIGTPTITASEVTGVDPEGSVDLSWSSVGGASGYELQQSDDDGATWDDLEDQTGTTLTVEDLAEGTYIYRVRGIVDEVIPGNWSEPTDDVVVPGAE